MTKSAQTVAANRLATIASDLDGRGGGAVATPAGSNPERLKFVAKLPAGLPVHLSPLNPINFLLRSAYIRPHRIAIKHTDRAYEINYVDWAMKVCALAYALKGLGIKRGDRVAVIAPNVPMILDVIQACPAIQAVVVPINVRLTLAEVDYILEHSGASVLIVDHEFAGLAKNFTKGPVIVSNDSCGSDPDDPYEQLLESGRRDALTRGWKELELMDDEDADFAICYTSGTTGRPKGVVTTFRGTYLAALSNVISAEMTHESVYLWILPAFHALGWTFPFAITAASAGQICLRSVGDYTPIWDAIIHDQVSHYCAAPTVQIQIANNKLADKVMHKCRTCIAGAAPSASLIASLEKLNIYVVHVYGLTETYGPITYCIQQPEWKTELDDAEFYKRKAMQGNAYVTSDEARVIRTESDPAKGFEDVKADGHEVGEIVLRGNLVMKGYWNDPEATAKAFEGGWFHTGDLAVRQPYGMVSVQDRSKDIIISGGENASSLAIESALFHHPDVLEVAVVARPHHKYGERAHAFVILRPDAATKWAGKDDEFEDDLKIFSRKHLPGFARPEWVEIVTSLPKTSTGKIQKHELRKRFPRIGIQ